MKDQDKTRAELLEELRELRLRFAALDSTQGDDDQTTTPNAIEHRTAILKKGHALARLGIYELVAPFGVEDVSWSQEMFRITGRSPALGAPAVQEYFDEIVHPRRSASTETGVGTPVEEGRKIRSPLPGRTS